VIRSLRKLVLGETRTVPVGVLVTLAVALVLDAAGPGWWERAGGSVVLGGALLTLVASLRYRGGGVSSRGGSTSGPAFGRATRRVPGSKQRIG
jgi:hypothetical protein